MQAQGRPQPPVILILLLAVAAALEFWLAFAMGSDLLS